MPMQNKPSPDTDVIDAYRRQMLEMYRNATPTSPTETEDENWLDSRYPLPNIPQDREAIPAPTPTTETVPPSPTFVGYLRVYAFTGGGAEPIVGARVIVSRPTDDRQTIYANLTTDADGFTPVIALPSVDPALTLQPGTAQPYVAYTVRVTADGFQPAEHRNVPVYGDNYVTQPVAMTPIVIGDANGGQIYTSGGPENL